MQDQTGHTSSTLGSHAHAKDAQHRARGRETPSRSGAKPIPAAAERPGVQATSTTGRDHGNASSRAPSVASREIGHRILTRVAQGGTGGRASRNLERDAIVTLEGDRVRVVVSSHFFAEYVGRNFVPALRQAAAAEMLASGLPAQDVAVDVVVEPDAFARPTARHASGERTHGDRPESDSRPAPPEAPRSRDSSSGAPRRAPAARDLRYRLSDFVVGECNRIAYTAACTVAEGTVPARFSPLFLHGPSGVGKTHLLQGLAHRAAERLDDRLGAGSRVRYTTAETFTNDFVQALRTNTTDAFRKGFRTVEILCIDDIHFLAGKAATQAEFLHTFDTLGLSGRMVVLASDESPREIRSLTEALVSRFLAGACIRIESPDDATRLALIRRLSGSRALPLDDDAVALVADRAGRPLPGGSLPSVREIEGLLTRIEATRNFMGPGEFDAPGGVITRSMVARALGLTATDGRVPRRPVPAPVIIERVCRALRVDATDLMSRGRHARVVLARALVTMLARKLTTMSYPEIARSMARPNHSTVITAHNRIKAQIAAGTTVEGGGPEFADVTIQSLADRIERDIMAAMS